MRPSLLDVSAQEGARLVALGYLEQACAACQRLGDPSDEEALHDMRVALRRLRSWLRAHEPVLEQSVGRKHRRRIRRLAERTGPARDSEVQLAWLERITEGAPEEHASGIAWVRGALERRQREGYESVRGHVERKLAKIDERLRPRLLRYTCSLRVGEPSDEPRFAAISAEAITAQRDELLGALERIESVDEQERAHAARIAGKRLRYLIEPFKAELESARDPLQRLKALQDRLGDLNDLHNLALTVGEALEEAAVERARQLRDAADQGADLESALRADERPGLLGLLSRIQTERSTTFDHLASEWLATSEPRDALRREIDALVEQLAQKPQDVEIERKYLLTALPPLCAEHEPTAIDQGYLPGERLVERIRRKRTASGETYVRTVKLGQGMVRIEVEEACSEEMFSKLWALTEGRRVEKRRYAIEAGDLVWEIDAFEDRELYLAEVELPTEDTTVIIPDWLAPYVEREVTGEDAYTNVNLAR